MTVEGLKKNLREQVDGYCTCSCPMCLSLLVRSAVALQVQKELESESEYIRHWGTLDEKNVEAALRNN